jgi:UDP-N-acetylglucosamine kinase
MNDAEIKIEAGAFEWIKYHKTDLIKAFANTTLYPADPLPTTIFMAGSPGAGKTEIARRISEVFKQKPVIIDADEIRKIIPGYSGKNAYLFQKAANKGVNYLYDFARNKNLNVILDGTFAYAGALENIEHSLKHNRNVEIYFIYQDPVLSWNFTKERELKEKRNVPRDIFIKSYIKSIENVAKAKSTFGPKIKLNIIVKDFEKGLNSLELNKDSLEKYIPKVYTKEELERLLV